MDDVITYCIGFTTPSSGIPCMGDIEDDPYAALMPPTSTFTDMIKRDEQGFYASALVMPTEPMGPPPEQVKAYCTLDSEQTAIWEDANTPLFLPSEDNDYPFSNVPASLVRPAGVSNEAFERMSRIGAKIRGIAVNTWGNVFISGGSVTLAPASDGSAGYLKGFSLLENRELTVSSRFLNGTFGVDHSQREIQGMGNIGFDNGITPGPLCITPDDKYMILFTESIMYTFTAVNEFNPEVTKTTAGNYQLAGQQVAGDFTGGQESHSSASIALSGASVQCGMSGGVYKIYYARSTTGSERRVGYYEWDPSVSAEPVWSNTPLRDGARYYSSIAVPQSTIDGDTSYLYLGDTTGRGIWQIDTSSGSETKLYDDAENSMLEEIVVSKNGRYLFYTQKLQSVQKVYRLDITTPTPMRELLPFTGDFPKTIEAMTLSPDDSTLFVAQWYDSTSDLGPSTTEIGIVPISLIVAPM